MPTSTRTPGNNLDPSQKNYNDTFDDIANKTPDYPDVEKGLSDLENFNRDNAADVDKSIAEREQEPSGGIINNFTGEKNKTKVKGKFLGKKSAWGLVGGIGGVGLIGGIFFFVMSLQGNMFLENITKVASQVPGYAAERRTEYMMTRLLAMHLLRTASGTAGADHDVDAKLVFCKNASVSCSLFATYGANYFDNIIDISIKNSSDDIVKMTLTPKGRTTLGGNARSWDLDIDRNLGDGQFTRTVTTLRSNSEAKLWVKDRVNTNLKTKNFMVRYLARLVLMKKYGITHWRAFERTANNLTEMKTKVKASILRNTAGKVSKRMSLYLGCLTDETTCTKLKDGLRGDASVAQDKANAAQDEIDKLDPDNPDYDKEKSRLEKDKQKFEKMKAGIDDLTGSTADLSDADIDSGSTKKIIMKRIGAIAGGVGVILTLDAVFGAIEALDSGAIDQIVADIRSYTYIGFAYGDETGIAPNVSKLMAGDADLESYGVLMSLFDGASESPLMQYENGLISAEQVASSSFTRKCDSENGPVQTTLQKGQLVCPERVIYTPGGISDAARSIPGWGVLSSIASGWNSSIGGVIDWAMTLVGDAINAIPGVTWLTERMEELTGPIIEWIMGLFFSPPEVGFEVSGADNYDAFSGGIWTSQNSLMEEGAGTDGKAYGGGGAVLTDTQVAAITKEVQLDELEDFNSQSLIARIFNPSLSGSFAQRFIAMIPTSAGSLLSFPTTSFSYAFNSSSNNASAALGSSVNPFNIARYGYAVDDPALTADPSIYTDAYCAETAAAREESYGYHPDIYAGFSTYTVSDPCALEKMVVGTMLQAEGVTDDKHSLNQLDGQSAVTTNSGERPEESNDLYDGWTLKPGVDYSSVECDSRTQDMGVYDTGSGGSKIRLCLVEDAEKYPGNYATIDIERSVSSLISTQVVDMLEDAYTAGYPLGLSSAYRGNNPYEHGKGLALDIKSKASGNSLCYIDGGNEQVWNDCKAGIGNESETAAFKWLLENASNYGFYNMAGKPLWEPWHWSVSGG